LKQLNIKTVSTEMTFGISRDQGLFEWAGTSLGSIFAQRESLWRPSFWRMIFDIVRFNQFALDVLIEEERSVSRESKAKKAPETIGQYLEREGYSASFRDDYLIPMTACVWSTSPDKCALEFPAVTLIRFL
jgi:predicted NAD/FAD-binding protein